METAGEGETAEVNHREEDEESKTKSKVERTTNSKITKWENRYMNELIMGYLTREERLMKEELNSKATKNKTKHTKIT